MMMNATNIIIIKEYIDDNLWLIIIIILFKFYFYLYIYIYILLGTEF